jgi:hypothetical protein
MQLEEIYPSSSMRSAFLASHSIHEVDASKVVLLPDLQQGWIAWIESCETHPELKEEYGKFVAQFGAKVTCLCHAERKFFEIASRISTETAHVVTSS